MAQIVQQQLLGSQLGKSQKNRDTAGGQSCLWVMDRIQGSMKWSAGIRVQRTIQWRTWPSKG